MSNLRRYYKSGNPYFVTNVTMDRRPILDDSYDLLEDSLHNKIGKENLRAYVILPDHFHAIIDSGDRDLSNVMKKAKLSFSSSYRKKT